MVNKQPINRFSMYRKHTRLVLLLVCALHLLALGFLVLAPAKLLAPANKSKPISVTFIQEAADTQKTTNIQKTNNAFQTQHKQPSIKPKAIIQEAVKQEAAMAQVKAAPPSNAQTPSKKQHIKKQAAKQQPKKQPKKQQQPQKQKQQQKPKEPKPINPVAVNQPMQAGLPFGRELPFRKELPFGKGQPFERELQAANSYTSSAVQTLPTGSEKTIQNAMKSSGKYHANGNTKDHTTNQQPTAGKDTNLQDMPAGLSLDQENDALDSFLAEDMLANDRPLHMLKDNADTSNINNGAVFKHKITPEYPKKEWINQKEGVVLLDFTIDGQGKVVEESINVISRTTPNFLAATKAALLASEFYPLIENGAAKKQSARHQAVFRRQAYLEIYKAVAKKEAAQTKQMQTNANMQRSAENSTENNTKSNAKSNTEKNNENNMEKQPKK